MVIKILSAISCHFCHSVDGGWGGLSYLHCPQQPCPRRSHYSRKICCPAPLNLLPAVVRVLLACTARSQILASPTTQSSLTLCTAGVYRMYGYTCKVESEPCTRLKSKLLRPHCTLYAVSEHVIPGACVARIIWWRVYCGELKWAFLCLEPWTRLSEQVL